MTHPRNAPPAGAGAEKAAFLRDLRALRDQAGLGPRDLAARAHFPEDTLTTAEAGPDLPSLPVLQAYVRGCGAGEAEWEDRWRRLNAADSESGPALPTRAPSSSRQPARVMPFPVSGSGPIDADPDAIGYGLARVARGLAPLSPEPANGHPGLGTRTPFGDAPAGNGEMRPSAEFSAPDHGSAEAGGWFDPPPKTTSPPPSTYTPPPAAPPTPTGSPAAPTVQYPAVTGYQASEHQALERSYQPPPPTYSPPPGHTAPPGHSAPPTHSAPSGRLPEEFRTPVPPPPDLSGPADGATSAPAAPSGMGSSGFGASAFGVGGPSAGATAPGPASTGAPGRGAPGTGTGTGTGGAASSSPAAPGATTATPKPHAAPATRQRRTSGWVIAAVIIILIIAAAIWLALSH